MITPYFGEFLLSVPPLELSTNWCTHACNYCSRADQPIMLANLRTKPAGKIVAGDKVLGWNRGAEINHQPTGKNKVTTSRYRTWEVAEVTHVFDRIAEVIEVELENGTKVVCTPDHHWYTGRAGTIEYLPVLTRGRIYPGRKMYKIDLPLLSEVKEDTDYMIGYCRGLMEGDGCWMPSKQWRVALADPEPLARLAKFLILMGLGHFDARPFASKTASMQQILLPPNSQANAMLNGCDIETKEYWRGWLSGIYDAEGNTPAKRNNKDQSALRISQYHSENPLTYQRIERALRLGNFGIVREPDGLRIFGGRLEQCRFVQYVQPAIVRKANPLIGSSFKGIQHPSKVVAWKPLGLAEVASFQTTTHNYIAGGCLSRNCFSNLNKPDRAATPKALVNLLATYQDRQTLTARLLKEGYPILFSNKVDPFANSNWRLSLQILELLAALKIPVAFQTKGGKGLEEAMSLIKQSCFYVSLTCQDDETAKRIEPGAPSMTERFRQIKILKENRHHVWAGVNPFVKEWIPQPEDFAKRLADNGINHVWCEILHLTSDQIKVMPERDRQNIGQPVLDRARQRQCDNDTMNHILRFVEACEANSIEFGCKHWPERTSCLEPYRKIYPKLFPSMTEWTNHCIDTMQRGQEFTFDDWSKFFLKDLPTVPRATGLSSYIYSCNRKLGNKTVNPEGWTYPEILEVIWENLEHRMCPSRSVAFKAVRQGERYKLDDNGRLVRYFTGRKIPGRG